MSKINQIPHAPLLEEVPDRLLDYYFHQRLHGMDIHDIKQSLINQVAQEDSVERAIKTIERMQMQYTKRQRHLRDARILIWGGLALLVAGVSLNGLSYFNAAQQYNFTLLYGLMLGGTLCLTIGFILNRKASSYRSSLIT